MSTQTALTPSHAIESIAIDTDSPCVFLEKECKTAIRDLSMEAAFYPSADNHAPYAIRLSIEESRLVMRIKNAAGEDLPMLVLSLKPYKRLIQDYFMIVGSYEEAVRNSDQRKVEAIDMGRRGVHNEGAELLIARLQDKITMDHDTARRLFTLICALHPGKALQWRS